MIEGKVINLRLVTEEDAKFILELRTNKELSKFISTTDIDEVEQRNWIKNYKKREEKKEEFYFIIENKKNTPCGTVRIYNIDYNKKSTTWGSFILDKIRPEGASNETIKLSLDFIFFNLNFEKVFLDVRKENYKAIHIYEKNGFQKKGMDIENYFYCIEKKNWLDILIY